MYYAIGAGVVAVIAVLAGMWLMAERAGLDQD